MAHGVAAAAATAAVAAVALRLLPDDLGGRARASVVLAYASLAALLLTLVLGPVQVLRRRPNPRSTDLRRDAGLWAAATGAAHVVLSLGNHLGGRPLRYFYDGGVRLDTFGVASWTGVAATVVLLALASISNDRSVRRLGPAWKRWQRANYALAVLTVAHTALFWNLTDRRRLIVLAAGAAVGVAAALQLAGFVAVRGARAAARGAGPVSRR